MTSTVCTAIYTSSTWCRQQARHLRHPPHYNSAPSGSVARSINHGTNLSCSVYEKNCKDAPRTPTPRPRVNICSELVKRKLLSKNQYLRFKLVN